jgi:endoribonuclease Dicer
MVVSTQIVLDAITKGFIKWDQIALMILDECRHAQKKHPMAVLTQLYGARLILRGFSEMPKVLGLTATIIKGQSKKLSIFNCQKTEIDVIPM